MPNKCRFRIHRDTVKSNGKDVHVAETTDSAGTHGVHFSHAASEKMVKDGIAEYV